MIRHDRIGDDIGLFDRAMKVLSEASTMEPDYSKGSDNMREITGANTNESKRHYIADEELGGIPREYVETARKADVGDYVYIHHCAETPEISGKIGKCLVNDEYDDGSIDVDIPSSIYGSYSFIDADYDDYYALSPTDIIRHNGERYRLVDRPAEVGETILVKANEEIWMRDMTVGKMYEVVLDYPGNYVEVMDDVNDPAQAVDGNYYVIEPVIDEQLADAPPEPQPDLIDLVIRLTRKVAELEKEVAAMSDTYDRNRYWTDHRLRIIRETANESDFKAGQALTTAELQQERVEMHSDSIELLTDDIITLDERMGAEEEKSKMITHVLGGSRMCRR